MKSLFLTFFCGLLSAFAGDSVNPSKYLPDVVREADSAVIEFYSSSGKEEVTVSDKLWLGRLAGILERSSYTPHSHCFCISYPKIHVFRKKEKIATLSVHHDQKLRAYADRVSGDFLVGAEIGKAISALAMERKKG